MSNIQDPELKMALEGVKLGKYYTKFLEAEILWCDLEDVTDDELKLVIPNSIHRKRLLKFLKSQKEKKESPDEVAIAEVEDDNSESTGSEKEEERVHMFVKCKQEVRKIYEIPQSISNEDLIGKLLQAFLECEVKLQDEEITLVKELKSFTLKDWKEKNELSPGKMLRAVLSLKGEILNTGSTEQELEKLRVENTELKSKLNENEKEMEKRLEKVQKEAAAKDVEIIKLKSELRGERAIIKGLKEVSKELKAKTRKHDKMIAAKKREMESAAVPNGFKSQRGIQVPQNVAFEVNEYCRSNLEKKVFSNGNKVAKGVGTSTTCFKLSAVFTAGKKFYFEFSAKVVSGWNMAFGIIGGAVAKDFVANHEKGWSYHCYPGGTPKRTYHNVQESSGYGPERTLGKHKFGIFCDFTNGKGEVSFVIDGKNWGVAYRNVKPPVSPAFNIQKKEDSFMIEDTFEVPDSV